MAQGTEFQIDIPVSADGVEPAAAAAARLASQLTVAQGAAAAAAAAVKAGAASYAAAETTADRAAKALEKVNLAAEAQRTKMQRALEASDPRAFWRAADAAQKLSERQVEAAAAADQAKAALSDEASKLAGLEADVIRLDAQERELASARDAARVAAETHAQAAAAEAAAIAEADAQIIASTANRMAVLMNAANQEAKAIAAEDAAIAAATAERMRVLMTAANEQAKAEEKVATEAKRAAAEAQKATKAAAGTGEAQDALEGIAKLSGPMGGVAMQAKEAVEGFKKLGKSLGGAGIYVAIAAAFVAMATGLALVSAAAIAGVAKVTWWAVELSDKQGLIKAQTARLEKGFKSLFSGLKITKLTDNLTRVVDLFDVTNASGKATKVVFESLFQPIVDGVADFVPKVRTAFLQFQILVLKALIAIKPFGSTILEVGKWLGIMAAVVIGVVVVAIALVVANLAIMAAGIAIVLNAVVAFIAGIVWLSLKLQELTAAVWDGIVGAFDAVSAWFASFSLAQVGSDMLDGLVNGILSAGPRVLAAMTGVVQGAVDSAKKLLGIASPSKVFAEIGGYTAEGMAVGVEDGTGAVQGALETMVAPPPAAGGVGTSAGAPAPSGGGPVYYIQITAKDGDAQSYVDAFSAWLASMGVQAGTAVPVG